jgi:glycerol-3-phosphate dehydrogenase (NAD(P)+)
MDTAETGRWHFCPERDGAKRPSKKVFVIGCGRWGTFIAWYLQKLGHCVTLYGRPGSKNMQALQATGHNEYVALDGQVALTCALDGLQNHDILVISVNAQGLQQLMDELRPYNLKNLSIVLCMKGIEIATGRRLSQVVAENVDPSNGIAVWLGPGHVEDFCRGIPNCMVIDSADQALKQTLVEDFSSELIRFYYGTDLIGNEIGAAAKNVMGIAAGMLDGLDISALKGPLMARGPREIARLIRAMGGSELTAYGLCHLGDYEATLFSAHSHNRTFGEHFILQKPYAKLAEGYYTVEALIRLGDRYGVELPICSAVYDILYRGQAPTAVLNHLFRRELTEEFC